MGKEKVDKRSRALAEVLFDTLDNKLLKGEFDGFDDYGKATFTVCRDNWPTLAIHAIDHAGYECYFELTVKLFEG